MSTLVVSVRASRAFALASVATRPLRRRFDLSVVYRYDLRGPACEFEPDVPVELKPASRAEVLEAAALTGGRFTQSFLDRSGDGMQCFVAKIDGRVVAYNWTRYRTGEDEGDLIVLRPGEIYTTDAFTAEEFRGLRIHTATLAYMLRHAKSLGYATAYTMGSLLKRGSRKTHPRIGWSASGYVARIGLGHRLHPLALRGSRRPLG